MPLISRAVPGLFGGVSQQFPAMRHPTQCELQDNALSTVVDGLYKRPGTTHVGFTPLTWFDWSLTRGNAFVHVIDRGDGNRWGVLLDGTDCKMVNMTTGAAETVTILNDSTYLAAVDPKAGFRCVTVADTTFIVNNEVTVTAGANDTYAQDSNVAYVYVRQAPAQNWFYITVNGTQVALQTPTTGAQVDELVPRIITALNGIAGVSASSILCSGLIKIYCSSPITSLTQSDSFGNSTMLVVLKETTKFSDLPPRFEAGVRVPIAGSGPNVDPYYVEWTGSEWKECLAPGVSLGLNGTTMPHKLTKSGAGGSWEFQRCTWDNRKVGDDETNPQPSFVGKRVRDIFFYRNRLGLLAGDSLVLSRSGRYFNFYGATATEILDNDPIDLGGASENIDTLDWAVPFNLDLSVWATSKQQFALASGDVLSPNTARLVPTTAFSSNNSARPRQLGNRIIYANTSQGHTQLGLYRVSRDTVSNTMESVTDHVPNYIPDNPRSIEVAESFRAAVVLPPGLTNELYVFKYEDDGEKLTQRAWQRFTFPCDGILKAYWANSKLYLFCYYKNSIIVAGQLKDQVALEVIDFDTSAVDTNADVALRLDRKMLPDSVASNGPPEQQQTVLTVPCRMLGTPTVLHSANGYTREFTVLQKTVGDASTSIVVQGVWTGGTVTVGNKFNMVYRFSEIFMRDSDGVPIISASMKVLKVLLRYMGTAFFKAKVATKAGGNYEYPFSGDIVGFGLGIGTQTNLLDGEFSIPVQANNKGTIITIESDSFLPCRFPYAEWKANVTMKAAR